MFKKLCTLLRQRKRRPRQASPRTAWHTQQIARNIDWVRDFWGSQQAVLSPPALIEQRAQPSACTA